MSPLPDQPALPSDFSGVVRLFPLPNLVMLPHGVQPLHVFESRYRQLLEDALAHDQLLTMALLQPGWEADYEKRPAIFPVTCVGRVIVHSRLEEGDYNILLHGLRRAAVIRELPAQEAYRAAEVTVLEDLYPVTEGDERADLRQQLLESFQGLLALSAAARRQVEPLLSQELPLGTLTDIVGFTLRFELPFKQRLLSERNVDIRAQMLLERLEFGDQEQVPWDHPFLPRFSDN